MVFLTFIYWIRYKENLLGGFFSFRRLKGRFVKRIFKLGLPVAALNTLYAFVNLFLSRTASEQGRHLGLMAFTTGGQIEAITWNTSQGFSTALSTFVAQNYAAGRKERVIKACRDRSSKSCEPSGSQMEFLAHLFPTEEHYSNKRGLHKKGENAFNS